MLLEDKDLWKAALGEIELAVSKANFVTWFKDTHLSRKDDGMVAIHVPNTFAKEWLEKKYHKYIIRALRNLTQDIKEVEYTLNPFESQNASVSMGLKYAKVLTPVLKVEDEQLEIKDFIVDKETGLNHKYIIENFVVGGSNELAYAAALSVIKNPGATYNPLFIYGGVGLGKTHLLQAIGNAINEKPDKKRVRYLSSERFTNDVIAGIQNHGMEKINDQYRKVDILIIDDIQFLAGKERTQEVFFHTFNSLYERNKQIILSSDRAPRAIPTLEERLRSRFEGGMLVDIGYPNYEMRVAILKTKIKSKNIFLSEEVIGYIANNIQKNVRELEGALNLVIASSKLNNNETNLEQAKKILSHITSKPNKPISYKKIFKTVSDFYEI